MSFLTVPVGHFVRVETISFVMSTSAIKKMGALYFKRKELDIRLGDNFKSISSLSMSKTSRFDTALHKKWYRFDVDG